MSTDKCAAKMREHNVNEACVKAFVAQHQTVVSGATGLISENTIEPATGLPNLDSLGVEPKDSLLKETVVLKLNGGLGTGMGLSNAKSLLKVKGEDTFLDFIAKQVLYFREKEPTLKFMLMNSFSTSEDTKAYLSKYPAFAGEVFTKEVELMQNKVPKVLQDGFDPVSYPADPQMEWCPPGHGDLYAALYGSGKLEELIKGGYKYMFVSNSDNLGATIDTRIVTYMAEKNLPFIMEVCQRTESDKKGGHLARNKTNNNLLLRESAQCPKEDEGEFQNIAKHQFFNTNNLWINLVALKSVMDAQGGMMDLPLIRNTKTVNPSDASSAAVYQLETAMGSAIASFDGASAIVVSRERFAPVKTCNDLLSLRSDAYVTTPDHRIVLAAEKPPVVDLEGKHYKFVDQFDALTVNGVPSMKACSKITVKGPVVLAAGITFAGEVTITNSGSERKEVPAGTHADTTIAL